MLTIIRKIMGQLNCPLVASICTDIYIYIYMLYFCQLFYTGVKLGLSYYAENIGRRSWGTGFSRRYLDLTGRKNRTSKVSLLQDLRLHKAESLFTYHYKAGWDWLGKWHIYERGEMHVGFWLQNLKKRNSFQGTDVAVRTTKKYWIDSLLIHSRETNRVRRNITTQSILI
jgi:hypothetical protein